MKIQNTTEHLSMVKSSLGTLLSVWGLLLCTLCIQIIIVYVSTQSNNNKDYVPLMIIATSLIIIDFYAISRLLSPQRYEIYIQNNIAVFTTRRLIGIKYREYNVDVNAIANITFNYYYMDYSDKRHGSKYISSNGGSHGIKSELYAIMADGSKIEILSDLLTLRGLGNLFKPPTDEFIQSHALLANEAETIAKYINKPLHRVLDKNTMEKLTDELLYS